jgi:hypothetical protein
MSAFKVPIAASQLQSSQEGKNMAIKDTIITITQETTTRYGVRLRGVISDAKLQHYTSEVDGAEDILGAIDCLMDAGADIAVYDTTGTRLESFTSVEGSYIVEPLQRYGYRQEVTTMLIPDERPDIAINPNPLDI